MRHGVKIIAGLSVLAGLAMPASGQTSEPASAKVSRRVQELVAPGNQTGPAPGSAPVAWPGAKAVEQLTAPSPAFNAVPPRPPVEARRPRLPLPLREGSGPLTRVVLPRQITFPTESLVQLPAVDVETPLPLPILARPKSDRATLDDVTLEASQAATLERVRLRYRQPVSFTPVNLPDPFENTRTGGLRFPPEENEQPPVVPIRTPGR